MEKLIEKALSEKRESKYIEFKSKFDAASQQDWCEIIKDIIAIANSGGGVIVIGVSNSGEPTDFNAEGFLEIDPADITNKISKYVGTHHPEFEIQQHRKDGKIVALILIQGISIPVVFNKPGTYDVGDGKQKTAFKEGSVYFRHGAQSAPGNSDDLQRAFNKELERVKKSWLGDIKKVVKAPSNSEIIVLPKEIIETTRGAASPIRLTTDPNAPAYRKIDPDITHPYRQKELIKEVKKRLPKGASFNSYDVTSIWYAHDIEKHPEFFHTPKFGSTQYSEAYVSWIVDRYKTDNDFFAKSRKKHYEIKHS